MHNISQIPLRVRRLIVCMIHNLCTPCAVFPHPLMVYLSCHPSFQQQLYRVYRVESRIARYAFGKTTAFLETLLKENFSSHQKSLRRNMSCQQWKCM